MDELTLWDLVGLILPDFGALGRWELAGINALIVSVIWGVTLSTLIYVVSQLVRALKRIAAVRTVVDGIEPTQLLASRHTMSGRALDLRETEPEVAHLWREFDETLVESPDGRSLWNTLDAEHFFNSHTLAGRLLHHPVLGAVPAVLTAIGVLGTFIGLTTGLSGLDLQGTTVDELRNGIDQLIVGASIAFMTSVWGVGLSLVTNVLEKGSQRRASTAIAKLQDQVDTLFKRHAPEQSLVRIMDSSAQTELAMQELHEKIGTKLQEAVDGISAELQTSLAKAIESAMAPSMERLAESTANQSSDALARLVEQFSAGLHEAGSQQAERLDGASATLAHTLEELHGGLSEQRGVIAEEAAAFKDQVQGLMAVLAEQTALLDSHLPIIVRGLETAAGHMDDSTSSLNTSAARLDGVSALFERTSGELTSALGENQEALRTMGDAQSSAAELLSKYASSIGAATEIAERSGAHLMSAAHSANEGFNALTEHQKQFLDGLGQKVIELNGTMSSWLAEYASQVQNQTADRMEEWNKQTREFTSNMVRASEGIQGAVEEINGAVSKELDDRFDRLVEQTSTRIDSWSSSSSSQSMQLLQTVQALAATVDGAGVRNGATRATEGAN